MSKAIYTGVGGIARKVPKLYVGVDGVARKVKKGYVGVDGVARLFYTAHEDLPAGYTVLEYITTSSPFHLVKVPVVNCRVVIDLVVGQTYSSTSYIARILSWSSKNTQNYSLLNVQYNRLYYNHTSQSFFYDNFGNTFPIGTYLSLDLDVQNLNLSIGGTDYKLNSTPNIQEDVDLYYGYADASNHMPYTFNGRIYGIKVYDNRILKCDLIPCKNPTGEVCFYDAVSNREIFPLVGSFAEGPIA